MSTESLRTLFGSDAMILTLSAGFEYFVFFKPNYSKYGLTCNGGPVYIVCPSESTITLSNIMKSSDDG